MLGGRLLILVPAFAILLRVSPAGGEEFYSQEKCSLCHIRESVFFSAGFAVPEVLEGFGEERVCYSCHNGTVQDDRDVLWQGAQHPPAASGDRAGGTRCSTCHSPHAKGGWGVLAGTSIPLRKGGDAVCARCHAGYARAEGGIHRAGFPDGGCAVCHRAHGGTGKALLREAAGTLCLKCHPERGPGKTDGHPVARSATASGERRPSPECLDCHPVHREETPGTARESRCADCHTFRKGPESSGAKGHPSEAKCTECHSFHEGTGGTGKGLRRENIRPTLLCGRCHAKHAADDPNKARQSGTHRTGSEAGGKDLCFRCHRIHSGAPGTALLVNGKSYSCLECHEEQNTISEIAGIVLAHPIFERIEKGRLAEAARTRRLTLGPAGEIVCRTCHSVHQASPETALLAPGMAGDGSCLWCHERMGGKDHLHPGNGAPGPGCGTCHPVHGRRASAVGGSDARDPWSTLCTTCHKQTASHVPGGLGSAGARPADMPGFDARGRKLRTGTISCPTCHEPHGTPRNKRLRRGYAASGFVCTSCHREKETVVLTPHDLRGISGKSVCEPCHLPHGGKAPRMWGGSAVGGETGSGACRFCHRDKGLGRPVPRGGHPVDIIVPRPVPDPFPLFSPAGDRARSGAMTCATCHEVHGTGFLPVGQMTGTLLRAEAGPAADDIGRIRTCLPCHQRKQAMHGQADCIWCHPPHEDQKAGLDCRGCHTMSGRGIARSHAERRLECGACHRIHAAKQGSPPIDACLGCHPKTGKIVGGGHGVLEGGPCRTCHPAHEDIEDKPVRRRSWEEIFAPDLPCLRCHRDNGEGPTVAQAEHPKSHKKVPTTYGAVVTIETPIVMLGRLQEGGKPLFPLFDEAGRQSLSGRMGCLTCHDPHAGVLISEGETRNVPSGYLRDPSGIFLSEVCSPCHRASAAEHAQKFHDLPRKSD